MTKKLSVRAGVLRCLQNGPMSGPDIADVLSDGQSIERRRKVYGSVYRALSTLTREGLVQAAKPTDNRCKDYELVR